MIMMIMMVVKMKMHMNIKMNLKMIMMTCWCSFQIKIPEAVDSGTGARWHMGQEERWSLGVWLLWKGCVPLRSGDPILRQ
jgi:hypothetical protein